MEGDFYLVKPILGDVLGSESPSVYPSESPSARPSESPPIVRVFDMVVISFWSLVFFFLSDLALNPTIDSSSFFDVTHINYCRMNVCRRKRNPATIDVATSTTKIVPPRCSVFKRRRRSA